VQELGFVPNGGRIYYVNRSQPPLLTQMIERYYEMTKDLSFLEQALPILNTEYEYWISNTSVELAPGYVLNRYYVINDAPRPESYLEDVTLAATIDPSGVADLYQQLATGAESGWDFSSRWMDHQPDLSSLQTTLVIPVDLNSILYKNEVTLSAFYKLLNQSDMEELYLFRSKSRLAAIQKFLWNDAVGTWNDRYLNGTFDSRYYPSNLLPFWAGAFGGLSSDQIAVMIRNLSDAFSFPGGVPTSLLPTGQQWDFPNGWAPIQYFVITGLNTVAGTVGLESGLRAQCAAIALQIASRWLTSNYCGWNETGMMFEKYDTTTRGIPGGGGEYGVQDGFGWTNGVVLHLLHLYGNQLSLDTCGNK